MSCLQSIYACLMKTRHVERHRKVLGCVKERIRLVLAKLKLVCCVDVKLDATSVLNFCWNPSIAWHGCWNGETRTSPYDKDKEEVNKWLSLEIDYLCICLFHFIMVLAFFYAPLDYIYIRNCTSHSTSKDKKM